jgi:hypothetical protein
MAGQLRVDEITDEAGTGSPSFPNGVDGAELTGSVAASLLTGNVAAARITDALNASGSAPVYACRAWVNFDGTTSPGTIRASGNVSSVTRNGTGDNTINFTTAMPDDNYAVKISGSRQLDSRQFGNSSYVSATTTSCRIFTGTESATGSLNWPLVSVSFIR